MKYLQKKAEELVLYAQLYKEWGANDGQLLMEKIEKELDETLEKLKKALIDPRLQEKEPDNYQQILVKRPQGKRMRQQPKAETLVEKMEGALLCRMIGCTLGASVENWSVERMEKWAAQIGDNFPPTDYWSKVYIPEEVRYGQSPLKTFDRVHMNGVPADDDVAYTLLGLLIAEKYGTDFTLNQVGEAWVEWLPMACTAEDVALRNLKKGIPADKAGEIDNPFCQWIGADIRSDPWAYIAAGWPEKAAQMAYQDAYLTHRRGGVYGAMYLAAAQAAAFCVDTVQEALEAGLLEIPEECTLAQDIRWALKVGPTLANWQEARKQVDLRFPDMSTVHTNNNMCLTIFGLLLGEKDVTRVLGETVAMGLDNDCTAASAGSILGAIVGARNIPSHWTKPFNDTVITYLNGHERFSIKDIVKRFVKLNDEVYK